jgi:hypothetical protein
MKKTKKEERFIKDLRARQKALSKQAEECADEDSQDVGDTWDAEVEAKLDLVEELLEKFDK